MHQVLIVTCDRDRWQFQIQCWSIGKYLEPVDLHIVINEPNPGAWLTWFADNAASYLSSHTVQVYSSRDILEESIHLTVVKNLILTSPGWNSQQVLKLLAGYKIQQPYTVLDTKNWFIKPSHIQLFKPQPRTGTHHNFLFSPFYNECLLRFNMVPYITTRPHITPFHFDPTVIKQLIDYFGGAEHFTCWFLSFNTPSEFIVYDLFVQKQGCDINESAVDNLNYGYWFQQPGVSSKLNSDTKINLLKVQVILSSARYHMLSIQPALATSAKVDALETLIGFTK